MGGYPKLLCLGTAVAVSRLAVLSQALAFLHPYPETGSSEALTGGTRPIAVQSPSNRGPIAAFGGETSVCSFQPLPAIRFGKHCLGLRKRKHSKGNFCARPHSQNEQDVRRQHATSIFMIITLPFRGPLAGQPRLEFYQSRGSTSCRCS